MPHLPVKFCKKSMNILEACVAERVEAKWVGKESNLSPILRTVAVATAGKTGAKWDFSPPIAADSLLPRRLLGLLLILVTLVLGGCGGGGGGSSGSGSAPAPGQGTSGTGSTNGTTQSNPSTSCITTISSGFTGKLDDTYSPPLTGGGGGGEGGGGSGGGSGGGAGAGGGEGKVVGGLMTITRLADGKVLGSAVTDSNNGLVTIAPCGSDLPVLLTLSGQTGAQYYDEGTEKMTSFPTGTSLHALVDQFDENVGVSFLTEGAYQYAVNNLGSANGSLNGLTLTQVQLANQKVLTAINANLPTALQLVTLKSLPTPIDNNSGANTLPDNRYGIAETVVGGIVTAAATAQPQSVAPALGLGVQLDSDLTDGNINGLNIIGAQAATGSNVYYIPATLPAATLTGMGAVAKQFGVSTILPLLQSSVNVSLSSTTIGLGQTSTLTWTTSNVTSCTASGSWSGAELTSGTLTLAPTITGNDVYILNCTGPAGSVSGQATLTVGTAIGPTVPTSPSVPTAPATPTVSISASPASISQGQSSTLTWSSSNATACTASGSWSGAQSVSGSSGVTPATAGTYTYGLTCTNAGVSASGQTTLVVTAPGVTAPSAPSGPSTPSAPTVSFSVNTTSITQGQSATLSWSAANATSCTASGNWSGTQVVSGASTVTPSAAGSYSYVLACSGAGGSTSQQAVLIATSPYQNLAQALFIAYVGRPAAPSGLLGMENALAGADTTGSLVSGGNTTLAAQLTALNTAYTNNPQIASVVNSIASSSESVAFYGSFSSTVTQAQAQSYVTAIFQDVFHRAPNSAAGAGLDLWSAAIVNNSVPPAMAPLAIMAGASAAADENQLVSSVTIANYFTFQVTALNATANYPGSGTAALADARNMMLNVSATTTLLSFEATVNNTIAAINQL